MRINLADKDKRQKGRKRGRKPSRRRSRTFDSAVAFPEIRQGASPDEGRRSTRSRRASARHRADRERSASPGRFLRAIRWRSVFLRLPVILALAALIGLAVYASSDARFFVYDAQIEGVHRLDADQVYQVAGVHEQNIFWIRPGEVAGRLGQVDGIRAVRVRCDLPALVTIEVEEREPLVMWRVTSQQQDFWLDEEGVVLPYHGDVNSPQMIFVVDSGERQLQVGDRIEPGGVVQSVLQLAEAVPEAQIFFYQPDRGLSFTQRVDGSEWPVYVGTSDDLARKIQVVQALNDYFAMHAIRPRYVDVRWADYPVYGDPAGASTGGGD